MKKILFVLAITVISVMACNKASVETVDAGDTVLVETDTVAIDTVKTDTVVVDTLITR